MAAKFREPPFKRGDMVIAKVFNHLWGEVLYAKPCGDLTMRWSDGTIGGEQAHNMRLMTTLEVMASGPPRTTPAS